MCAQQALLLGTRVFSPASPQYGFGAHIEGAYIEGEAAASPASPQQYASRLEGEVCLEVKVGTAACPQGEVGTAACPQGELPAEKPLHKV